MLAVAQIYGQVQLSSAVRAFDDCFLVAATACVIGIIPALFLKNAARARPGAGGPGRPAPAHHEPVEI